MTHDMLKQYSRRDLRHALKRADPLIFEEVLKFLEDDPQTHGAGYWRVDIWKNIRRYPLTQNDIWRLERVAISYLQRPMVREFKIMCQAMTWIATPNFWPRVAEKMNTGTWQEKLNASCLYPYSQGMYSGESHRMAIRRERQKSAWRELRDVIPGFETFTLKPLIDLLYEPDHWRGKKAVRLLKSPNLKDLPIAYYGPEQETELATFYILVSTVNPYILLPKLEALLMDPSRKTESHVIWLYVIYILHKMNDTRTVPILIKFLHMKVDFKFMRTYRHSLLSAGLDFAEYFHVNHGFHLESDTRYLLLSAVLKTLRY